MFPRHQLAVAVWRAPAEARQRSAAGMRPFSTTRVARDADFYEVLRLPRNASRAQIKSQFYKLSKEYHPDISSTEDAKAKFQQVSEAYATLGNDKARREYDQRFAARSLAGMRSGGGASAAENQTRRSTANYAWDYQRRQTARQQKANQAAGASSAGAQRFRAAQATPTGASNLFSRMMERESRLEKQRMQSGPQGPRGNPDTFKGYSSRRWSEAEREVETTSPVKRFLQVGCVLGGALWLSAKIIAPSESS